MEAKLRNWNFQVSNMEYHDHHHHHGNNNNNNNVLLDPPVLWTSTFPPFHSHNLQLPPRAQLEVPPPPPDDAEEDVDDEPEEELSAMKEMMYKIAAMQPVHIDPATIRKPKRRNVRISDDPQSVAARHRRERISEKIRILQRLVPGGTKMDTASMLDEAIRYVKFLRRQIRLLQSSNPPPPQHHPHLLPPPPLTPPPGKQSLPLLVNNNNNIYQSALI